jgi:hypothetical protein
MLILPEGQTGEASKPSKKKIRNRGALDRTALSFSLALKGFINRKETHKIINIFLSCCSTL